MKKVQAVFFIILLIACMTTPIRAATNLPGPDTLRTWVQEMKTSPKGPFARIRWFCDDGTVLPPKPYACRDHGGGVQHGEWTDRVKRLRAGGYYVGNVLASLDLGQIEDAPGYSDLFNQIIIEKFLIAVDDGWVFRKARYYRGAVQAEDETAQARRLLLGLADKESWTSRGFVPLRAGANFLEHGVETTTVSEVRQHSLSLSEKDGRFMPIRTKIHNQPDPEDAKLVREYAAKVRNTELAAEYESLAKKIDQVYASEAVSKRLKKLSQQISDNPELSRTIAAAIKSLEKNRDPSRRFEITGKLMAEIRQQFARSKGAKSRLAALDTSLALEVENFTAATALKKRLNGASRRERLQWLRESTFAIYGAGLISARQLGDLQGALSNLEGNTVALDTYKASLDYLALVPGWSSQWMRFHFSESMMKLAALEPLTNRFIDDGLRGSALLFYSQVLDGLLRDANHLAGVRRELFGQDVGGGLRSLNPGLAQGTLRLSPGDSVDEFEADSIYLLPETIAELPPVAGILTAGEGNPLSHIQLLARNLGIPNVVVDEGLIPQLSAYEGKKVILAASPAGAVQLMKDEGQLDNLLSQTAKSESLIHPDLEKLDLKTIGFVPVSGLRASDSGRIVGPKAGNLGELYQAYPDKVAKGLAIPFGAFRSLLDQPMGDGKQTVFEWMERQYAELQAMPPGPKEREKRTESFREQLEEYILKADPGEEFRRSLHTAMEKTFGKDGSYGVFVRSDTNVEDLPGFTGAGLNKTVPNVIGFDNVLAAISQVWASPFSKRAFAWRQAHMELPQHVYASVLLLQSVPSEKSGVLVTHDIDTGKAGWLSVAINEGVGGAVEGQAAESLRINMQTGEARMLTQATAPRRAVLRSTGGLDRELVSETETVLKPEEIRQLIVLARELPERFPSISDARGNPAPADIEFGFLKGELQLFQIRPFLESAKAQSNEYLNNLDKDIVAHLNEKVKLDEQPL